MKDMISVYELREFLIEYLNSKEFEVYHGNNKDREGFSRSGIEKFVYWLESKIFSRK